MNNHRKITLFVFIFLLFFVWGHFTLEIPFVLAENVDNAVFFNKNLKIGDKNEDVRALQIILNKNLATEVSSFGAGSPGNETDFFGQLTKNAVIKFQELYTSDILGPSGLVSGTGFVGVATRLKLNSLTENTTQNNQTSSISKSKSSQIQTKASNNSSSLGSYKVIVEPESVTVRVYNTSEYQVLPGSTVILRGVGFGSRGNTVYLGENRSVSNLPTNEDGTEISFVVPKDLSLGKYNIWVKTPNGSSKNETIKIHIIVTDNPAERPVVEKIEPTKAGIDSEIVVSGKGFTSKGNNIYSMFGNIMNISSSDGRILRFNTSSMSQLAKIQAEKSVKNTPIEVSFYIVNDNGYNIKPASFIIEF